MPNKSKATLFQKYMVIRLNEIIFRKQLFLAFKELKKLKKHNSKVNLPTTNTLNHYEQRQYSVHLEIIRPKLRGEIIFKKCYDITNVSLKRRKMRYLKNIPEINSKLIDDRLKEEENKLNQQQTQNLKQLIKLQNQNKQKLRSPKPLSQCKKADGAQYIISLFIVLLILYLKI